MEEKNFENEATPKFCPQCGSPLSPEAKFCPKCGKVLGEAAQEAENVANTTAETTNDAKNAFKDVAGKLNPLTEMLEGQNIDIGGMKLTLLQVIVAVASFVSIIMCFLPFCGAMGYSYSWMSKNFLGRNGFISIILVLGICALIFFKKKFTAMILAILNFVMILKDMIIVKDVGEGYIHLGVGAWIGFLMALVIVAMAVLTFISDKNK